MQYGTIAGIGKPVARLACGTMVITDEEEARPKGPWGDLNREMSFALLDAIAAGGGNTFDTAHVYGIGGAGAKRKDASIAQIALAFLLTGPLNVFALTGPRSPAEFADNAAALDVVLSPAERAWLDLDTDTAP